MFPSTYIRRFHMKKNMGLMDRGIRILLGLVVVVLYVNQLISGVAAVILGIIAVVFFLTGLIGFCPLYVPLKIDTGTNKDYSGDEE